MIKGLIALFTSGIIFNPMVLLGVISGSYTIINLKPEEIRLLMINANFYVAVCVLANIDYKIFGLVS